MKSNGQEIVKGKNQSKSMAQKKKHNNRGIED